jgi:hypothetical protein
MASFVLRKINPEFWQRVQAKAAAEGSTVKAVILRLLTAWLAAVIVLSVTACGYKNPTAPTVDTPAVSTAPASIQLLGASRKDGLVDVTARVLTADGHDVPGAPVSFSTSVGSITPDVAQTDATGRATALLTATEPSTVTATSGTLTTSVKLLSSLPAPVDPGQPQPFPKPTPPQPFPPEPSKPGSYQVTLRATPTALLVGGSAILSALVNRTDDAPEPSSYTWDCGTGTAVVTTPAAAQPCSYPTAGTFTARVTATGGAISGTGTASVTVTPPPPPPPPTLTISLTGSANSVPTGSAINFTATAGGFAVGETVTAYQWDLDDTAGFEGTSTTNTRTSAAYTVAGLFVATVKVTTSTGRTASATFHYVVTN